MTQSLNNNDDGMFPSNSQADDNAFVLNNYDIIESFKNENNNIITYLGSSFFDNEFYQIKRKKLVDYKDDISNLE